MYDLLAPVYDKINGDIDYGLWADFLESAVSKYSGVRPKLVLDLGCGTGRMALELAGRGYDLTGVDASAEMLDIARSAAEERGLDILWLLQDMQGFELYGTVDLTVSCLDCINHLKPKEARECFKLVHNYLVPGGLFIFDVNGKSKFENVYSDRAYVFEEEQGTVVWQNSYSAKNRTCNFLISVFSEENDGRYSRFDSLGREYMYTIRSLKSMLKSAGLEFMGAFSDFSFSTATDGDERIYIVAKCIK